ncbi:redoxin domain-containing protein [Alphaproteobacteria bacterium HT1-32]|nr:redoxin domain-containing protein [Alphaproteobacteria bacterium HT1-32]
MQRLLPTQSMPDIDIHLAGGERWRLAENAPDFMLMIDVFRGVHCPRCRRHLEEMSTRHEEFREAGLKIIAMSADPAERAEQSRREWDIPNVPLGYGLPIQVARQLGLYISENYASHESEIFAEPGVFFVMPDLTLYGAVINTFPFARPKIDDLLEVARIVKERNYPPRGTLAS